MPTKFALFDADKTLFSGDSLIAFYWFGLKKRPFCILLLPLIPIAALLMVCKILPIEWFKALFYAPIGAFNDLDFEEFFNTCLLPRRIPKSWESLLDAKEKGYHVLVVSASPEAYLLPLLRRGLCDGVIGSPLRYRNGRYSPLASGKNCAKQEKVRRILAYCNEHNLSIDFDNSIGFSDSDRDRFMLDLVHTRTRVTKAGEHIPYEI